MNLDKIWYFLADIIDKKYSKGKNTYICHKSNAFYRYITYKSRVNISWNTYVLHICIYAKRIYKKKISVDTIYLITLLPLF